MEFREETDHLGRALQLPKFPKRIVSLVPSQTEFLHSLGLEHEVVGITKFCIHPDSWFRSKARIGGTKKVNIEKVAALKPDLVIANKEENTESDIRALEAICPVWISDISDLDSALDMMKKLGRITNRSDEAFEICNRIVNDFDQLTTTQNTTKVAYLIWKNPLMAAGNGTFIDAMLKLCGFENAVTQSRYPIIENEELSNMNADLVMLSSEPFPFKGKHTAELRASFPSLKFMEVDGELFSWYGSRLLHSSAYFSSIISSLKTL